METRRSLPLRILAPLALVVAAVALVMILSSASGDSGSSKKPSANSEEKARDLGSKSDGENKTPRKRDRDKLPQKYYIVKTGDTLGGIAETTGVKIDDLIRLNPDLDQFSLRTGQKIKLR